ncbi:SbcC/MukB-like Walker B domain-containing protein, partial [Nocardioides jensenii]|uniref:SbcC/MukB-like Walker B domain-containing protein n=1 Tax=Nocardioides jensenii TaxID=1843 RepID=UPI000B2B0155
AREAAVEAERLSADVAVVVARLAAHDRIASLRTELATARDQRRSHTDVCQALKEHWLELCEARIRGMAAEIATDLAVGASCPVCGSADHPHKAEPAPGAPTATAEKEARRRLDDAEGERTAHDLKVHELTATLGLLEREVGTTSREQDLAAHDATERAHVAAANRARARGELEAALVLAERSLQAARADLESCRVELAATRTQLDADQAEHQRIATVIDGLLDGSGHSELASLISDRHHLAEACEAALRLEHASRVATQRAADAEADLSAWLAEHDFAAPDDALTAVLTDGEAQRLESEIARHESRLSASRAVLEDPAVADALLQPARDTAAADALHVARLDDLGAARSAAQVSEVRARRLVDLGAQLETTLEAWRPLHTAYAVAAELAAFVEGKSADNELRMRLSAYVLAWRLTQVVAAANERLLRMSDQRYSLEHTGRRGAGESRGGLSLLVLDEWSGEHRDPATLSGGETFVVSLALALGLADVVTQEAGGAELDTLFVDEGFGSLDSETLDDVMDTLDTLRDGGRVVGVVSHVAEMRSRIPTQLSVAKDRTGSSVAITRAAG